VRVREVAFIAANGIILLVLSGCSSATAPSWVPGWMTIKPEPQALRFESTPPGADVSQHRTKSAASDLQNTLFSHASLEQTVGDGCFEWLCAANARR
jgi:hypothetical protein